MLWICWKEICVLLQFFTFVWSIDTKNFVGRRCTLSGKRNYGGLCKLLQDCPAAISNLRAGVFPSICVHVGKIAVVCCPVQRRISFEKCEEYEKLINEKTGNKATSLLLGIGNGKNSTSDKTNISNVGFPVLFVVGGSNAGRDEFPHTVALGYESGSKNVSWRCSGTLISPEFVLSAAHCLKETKRGKLTKILLGDVTLNGNDDDESRLVVDVDTVINHPNYAAGLKYNDIVLVKLKKKVKLSKSIRPACLPQPFDRLELSPDQLIAHGWGLTEFAGSPSEWLQYVRLTRFSQSECNKEYANQPDRNITFPRGILNTQLCAGNRDKDEAKDTCDGDSGSGLVLKKQVSDLRTYYVIGITSFGSKYCGYGPPGIYTNVQSYMDWIESAVWL